MSDSAKRWTAVVLFVLALGLSAFGLAQWQSANDDAAHAKLENTFARSFGNPESDASADHGSQYAMFVVAGLCVVCGVILLASAKPAERSEVEQ